MLRSTGHGEPDAAERLHKESLALTVGLPLPCFALLNNVLKLQWSWFFFFSAESGRTGNLIELL